jgi:hypothetical protein
MSDVRKVKKELIPFQSPHLHEILTREIAAGNVIAEDGPPLGNLVRFILLAHPFHTPLPDSSDTLVIREINDPHWWKTEIEDPKTMEMVACKF